MAGAQIRSISCAAAILALCGAAVAQQAPPPAPPADSPSAPNMQRVVPEAPPTKAPAVKPSEAPAESATPSLVGLDVFSSDGTRIGEVRAMGSGPTGAGELHVRTGGFLGFGGKIVAVPEGRYARSGQSIRLDLDSSQVNNLPTVND